jgi:hypothetical protein
MDPGSSRSWGRACRKPALVGVIALAAVCGASEGASATPALAGPRPPLPAEAPPAPPPTAAGPRCSVGERGAIAELACELGKSLGPAGVGTVVAVAAPVSDRAITRAPELSGRLAAALAGALGAGVEILPGTPTLGEARAVARSAKAIVFVTPEIAGGEVRATGDVYPVTRGFWDRLRARPAPPVRHAFASRRLDGEVASFLPKVPLVATRTEHAIFPTTDVVALACGDADLDGALELVVLGRRKIQIGRIRGGRFAPSIETAWASLSPVAPAPLREPVGAASIAPGRAISAGLTDRASGVRLSPSLTLLAKLDLVLPFEHVGCLARSGVALGLPGPCDRGTAARIEAPDLTDADAIASGRAVAPDGHARAVVAWRSARDRGVSLRDDAGHTARVALAGAALALGDVDLDGAPELIASTDTLDPAADALVVWSWDASGNVGERLRIPVPEGIRAIAICPPEDAHMAPIAVATTSGLWIVR